MDNYTCLCRPMAPDGPDSARIGQVDHCPVHAPKVQPNLVIELGKGKIELYDTKRFAELTGKSVDTLYRRKKDPARVKWGGDTYWSPQLLAASIVPKEVFEAVDFTPITREDIEAGMGNLRVVNGGQR